MKTNETRLRKTIDVAAETVTITVPGLPPVVINAAALSSDVRQYAMLAGLGHTVGDAAAIEYRQANGSIVKPTLEQKRTLMVERLETLQSGQWTTARESEDASLLVEALIMLSGATRETVEAELSGMTAEERRDMQRDPQIGYRILEIRRNRQFARAKEAPQSDALAGVMAKLKKAK
jgi:hypothetical protein